MSYNSKTNGVVPITSNAPMRTRMTRICFCEERSFISQILCRWEANQVLKERHGERAHPLVISRYRGQLQRRSCSRVEEIKGYGSRPMDGCQNWLTIDVTQRKCAHGVARPCFEKLSEWIRDELAVLCESGGSGPKSAQILQQIDSDRRDRDHSLPESETTLSTTGHRSRAKRLARPREAG